MEATNQTSPEEALRLKVELLFSRYFEHQPAEDLKTISEYFEFVAARVQIRSGEIGVDVGLEFLRHFEAVC
jgi:hypothetical protein